MEKGAATLSPNTFLRALGKKPFSIAYLEPCRRPIDSRYAKDKTERYQWYYQYQVLIKPTIKNPKEMFLKSLAVLGINDTTNKIEFIDDTCESPVFGAKFRGWEVWIDGMEIAQVSYLDEVGGIKCNPLSLEIAYGLERIALKVQKVDSFHEIRWNENMTYGDLYKDSEIEQSVYNMETSSPDILEKLVDLYLEEARRQLEKSLVYPTMDYLLKASHTYNLLEANKNFSKNKLDIFLKDIKYLSHQIGLLYIHKTDNI
jgi:glycyl-tRNA synthetase alpha chain